MFTKPITYIDYDGNERTEKFLFNLTEAELTMWQLERAGGMKTYLEKIIDAQDAPAIMNNFRKIIHMAYGEKSDDGRRFIKKAPDGHDLADDFEQTEAYSVLFMELISDDKAAAAFINELMPKGFSATQTKAIEA